jgi:hypothetical protein
MTTIKLTALFIGIGLLVAFAVVKDFFFSFGRTKSDLDEANYEREIKIAAMRKGFSQ